jgi:hypothetical protein
MLIFIETCHCLKAFMAKPWAEEDNCLFQNNPNFVFINSEYQGQRRVLTVITQLLLSSLQVRGILLTVIQVNLLIFHDLKDTGNRQDGHNFQ